MKRFSVLLAVLSCIVVGAQQAPSMYIDSLLKEMSKQKDDTLKAKILYQVVLKYTETDPDKTIEYAKQGLNLSRKAGWKKGEASFLISLGNAYSYKGEYSGAILLLDTAITINKAISNTKGLAVGLNTTAGIYLQQGNHTKAIEYFFQSLKLAESIKDTLATGDANFNIAAAFASQNDNAKALKYHLLARWQYEAVKNLNRLEIAYTSLGLDYINLQSYEDARPYLSRALAINNETGNNRQRAFIYANLGSLYTSLKDYRYALMNLKLSNGLWNEIAPESQHAISVIGNIGGIYLNMAQDDSIIPTEMRGNPGYTKAALLDSSENWLRMAVRLYRQNGDLAYEAVYGQMLADVYSLRGDYKSAFENYRLYHGRDDSIHSQESKNAIAAVEGEREIALRDKEIQINKLALSNTRKKQLALVIGIFLLAIIGTLLFWQSRVRKRTNTTLLQLNTELDEANKLKAKFFGILSHDFRAPVSRLVHFLHLRKEDSGLWSADQAESLEKKITVSAESLLENMESMLTWSKGQMENFKPSMSAVTVSELFHFVKNTYTGIEPIKLEFDDPGNLHVITDEHYLKTIMQNLTSNAVRALSKTQDGIIVWRAVKEKDKIVMSITDNGPGVSREQVKALQDETATVTMKEGLGFHLVRDLAKLIKCTISVESKPNEGTSFLLTF